MAARFNSSLNQTIGQYIIDFDTFAHRTLGNFFGLMPGSNKDLSGFLFLCLIALAITGASLSVGGTISLLPLFVLPIVLSAIYLPRKYAYALALISSLLRVESFRVSSVPEGETFSFLLNFLPAFCAYIAVAEFGALATNTIRELAGYIDALHDELALERIVGAGPRRAEDEKSEMDRKSV